MKKINENTKVTLTIGQLKKLVKESDDRDFLDYSQKDVEQQFGKLINLIANAIYKSKDEAALDQYTAILKNTTELMDKFSITYDKNLIDWMYFDIDSMRDSWDHEK